MAAPWCWGRGPYKAPCVPCGLLAVLLSQILEAPTHPTPVCEVKGSRASRLIANHLGQQPQLCTE